MVNNQLISCYDDRYILQYASDCNGVVVSNDIYRDLVQEKASFKSVVQERLLMYTFVNDKFMPPEDPLGRHGPNLSQFLSFDKSTSGIPLPAAHFAQKCPYDKKCTYGNKCKFFHPERSATSAHKSVADLIQENSLKTVSSSGKTKLNSRNSLPLHLSTESIGGNGFSNSQKNLINNKMQLCRTKSNMLDTSLSNFATMHQQNQEPSRNTSSTTAPLHKKLERQLTLNPDSDPRLKSLMDKHEPTNKSSNKPKLSQTKSYGSLDCGNNKYLLSVPGPSNLSRSRSGFSPNHQPAPPSLMVTSPTINFANFQQPIDMHHSKPYSTAMNQPTIMPVPQQYRGNVPNHHQASQQSNRVNQSLYQLQQFNNNFMNQANRIRNPNFSSTQNLFRPQDSHLQVDANCFGTSNQLTNNMASPNSSHTQVTRNLSAPETHNRDPNQSSQVTYLPEPILPAPRCYLPSNNTSSFAKQALLPAHRMPLSLSSTSIASASSSSTPPCFMVENSECETFLTDGEVADPLGLTNHHHLLTINNTQQQPNRQAKTLSNVHGGGGSFDSSFQSTSNYYPSTSNQSSSQHHAYLQSSTSSPITGNNFGGPLPVHQNASSNPSTGSLGSDTSTSQSASSFDLSDKRYRIYFHLSSIFPPEQVKRAMCELPDETNPQEICAAILRMGPN